MKATPVPIFLTATLVAGSLAAQVFNQPSGGSRPSNGSTNTTIIQKNEEKSKGNLLGGDIPLFDPSSEVAMWDGQAWNVNDNRLLSATFEAYLAEPAHDSDEDLEYYSIMDRIVEILSPTNHDKNKVRQAIILLPQAATYPQDANQCEALLNAVFRVYLAQRDITSVENEISSMSEENARLIWKGDLKASEGILTDNPSAGGGASSRRSNNRNAPRQGGNNGASGGSGKGTRSLAYEQIVYKLNLNRAEEKVLQASTAVKLAKAKAEYQLMLAHLFLQRRFEHCLIGCRFYDQIFKEGESTLRLKKDSDVARLFGEGLGGNPTVGTVQSFANEAINRASRSVEAFEHHLARNEMFSAYKRLQEAFMVGQYLPSVRTLEMEKKQKVQGFARDMFKLTSALQVKDFQLAMDLIEEMRRDAVDFDTTKHQALARASMKQSNMHIAKAGMLFSDGKMEEAEAELRKAAEIWPSNPKIDEVMDETGEQMLEKNRIVKDFDRLVAERNHREIYDRKGEFLGVLALTKDTERQAKLEQILTDMLTIETAIEESRKLEESAIPGAVYAAWEAVQELVVQYPDDAPLRVRAEELSRKSVEFVSALQRARESAKMGNTGSALSLLMEARQIYPDSKRAKEGIRRILDRILPADGDLFDAPVDLGAGAVTTGADEPPMPGRRAPVADPFN